MGSAACAETGTSFRLAAVDKRGGLNAKTLQCENGSRVAVKHKGNTMQQDHGRALKLP